jgi:hypothetical protein
MRQRPDPPNPRYWTCIAIDQDSIPFLSKHEQLLTSLVDGRIPFTTYCINISQAIVAALDGSQGAQTSKI